MKKSINYLIVVFLAGLVLGSPVFGQKRGMGGFRGGSDSHQKNLENLRLLKLLEVLELSETQETEFILYFSTFRKESRELNSRYQEEIDKLSEILKTDDSSETTIYTLIDTLIKLREDMITTRKKFGDNMKKLLTPVQLGKMVVFEERFERELLETVRGFHNRQTPRPGDAPVQPLIDPFPCGRP